MNECLADVNAALDQLTLHRAVLQLVDESKATEKAGNIMDTVKGFVQDGRKIFHILSRDAVFISSEFVGTVAIRHFFGHVMELNDLLDGLPFGADVMSLAKEVIQTDLPNGLKQRLATTLVRLGTSLPLYQRLVTPSMMNGSS